MTDQAVNEPHRIDVRVYYEDTDFSGYVYHAGYLRFLERGRTEFLRTAGLAHSMLHREDRGLVFVVSRLSVDYLRPARMDDVVTVETRVAELKRASVLFGQIMRRGETLLLHAEVLVAAVRDGRPVRLPVALARHVSA